MAWMQTHGVACRRCDWKAVWRGGDVVMLPRRDCPHCGGELAPFPMGVAERLNPVYRLNYLRLLAAAPR